MSCNCPENDCAECVFPPIDCVYRLEGQIEILPCLKCSPDALGCWHHNGQCLRCNYEAKYS